MGTHGVDLDGLTATVAREDDTTVAAIAAVTGLSEATVRRRLGGVHGNTLVQNVFEAEWPDERQAIEQMNVAVAREHDEAWAIAAATGLTEVKVRRRLEQAHGRTLVRNLFEAEWPSESVDVEALDEMTVAHARDEGTAVTAIAEVTGLGETAVRRRLDQAHGKMLVHNLFEAEWPDEDFDLDTIRGLTVAAARDDDTVAAAIAEATGLGEMAVRRRLEEAHGKTMVRNLFEGEWQDANKEDVDALAQLTAAAAREDAPTVNAIAAATGIGEKAVRRRLADAHGKTLVRNVFDVEWPSQDGDDVDAEEEETIRGTKRAGPHPRPRRPDRGGRNTGACRTRSPISADSAPLTYLQTSHSAEVFAPTSYGIELPRIPLARFLFTCLKSSEVGAVRSQNRSSRSRPRTIATTQKLR